MSMKPRRLGRSGLLVSPLCLGTMNFGWKADEEVGRRVMDRALDAGVNFFDTADAYGAERGETERIIGRWWAGDAAKRDRVVLATKVYGAVPQEHPEPNRGTPSLSARKIIRHCEDSLKRLQTDVIDLYQMHHVDRACPFDEIWDAYETLVRQGKVIYAGSSNFAGWDIATANQTAARLGLPGLVSEQSLYNLIDRTIELEVIPCCRHYGVGLIPWSPLCRGILGGIGHKGERRAARDTQEKLSRVRERVERYEALCRDMGERPADVALAWLLTNPVVTAPIIGPRTMEQFEESLRAVELAPLEQDVMQRLDEIWPGPGGEAPKAYAW